MEEPEEVEIRKAPKVLPFAFTGAGLGMLVAAVLYLAFPDNQQTAENIFGLLLVALGSLGLGLGIALAVAADLVTATRAKKATAVRSERETQ